MSWLNFQLVKSGSINPSSVFHSGSFISWENLFSAEFETSGVTLGMAHILVVSWHPDLNPFHRQRHHPR